MKKISLHGFTLVEVMVVMLIVSILAGLLFPVFQAAKRRAFASACASNLAQAGRGLILYSSDNDDRVPFSVGGRTAKLCELVPSTSECSFYPKTKVEVALQPYLKARQTFKCPTEKPQANIWGPSSFDATGTSYLYDDDSLSIGDSLSTLSSTGYAFGWEGWNHGGELATEAHVNLLFYDGHVQFIVWNRALDFL